MRRRVVNLAVAFLVLVVPFVVCAGPARADTTGDLLTMVNTLRASVGRSALSPEPTLTSVAQQWAQHMAATATLAHNPNLSGQVPAGWTKIGENVGYGGSLTAVYNALVASTNHYANMVDPAYNLTGVGVATDAKGTVWVTEDFEAGPAPAPAPAGFVRPTSGATNVDTSLAFSWTAAPAATLYYLTVGAARGGGELVSSGALPPSQTSYLVTPLPSGQTLWARIYSYIGGSWNNFRDATFTAAPAATQASFTFPVNGQVSVDTTRPFTWSTVPQAQGYYLIVGTALYGYDLVNTGAMPAGQSSVNVPALPSGRTLYATLFTEINGAWNSYQAITFTAAPGVASFTYPADGQLNVDTTKAFSWTTVTGAQGYYLVVGTVLYGADLVNSGVIPAGQSSLSMPAMPSGVTLYATLFTEVNGTWARYQSITFRR